MPELEMFLLGRFHVLVDGVPIAEQRWSRKKAKVLLKLLALAPQHTIHREQLMSLLWPDLEDAAAQNNFYKVVHAARRTLEPRFVEGVSRFLLTQESLVSLAWGKVWIDVEEFEARLPHALTTGDVAELESVLELYRADLLPEDLYEDWASLRREQLRLEYHRALNCLAAHLETLADERAIAVLNKLLASHPAHEDAHRRLMRIYAALGQRQLALQQFRICSEALKKDLDVTPEHETVQLYESLLAGINEAPRVARVAVAAADMTVESGRLADGFPSAPVVRQGWQPQTHSRSIVVLLSAGFLLAAAVLWFTLGWQQSKTEIPSIAILPLRTATASGEGEAVADGVTEELINNVSRLRGVRTMARATVFVYHERTDARNVGRELKVSTVLSGFLNQQQQTITLGLELIDVADGSRLWARKYSCSADKLSALQQLVASELETAVRDKISGQRSQALVRTSPTDPEAHRLYLSGRSFWNLRTKAGFLKSIEYYQSAVQRDPRYALAYAGLADSYGLLGWESGDPRQYFPKARDAAVKALELDKSLAEAQTTLAMVSALYEWNWVAAEAHFRRAIELNSGYVTAHHWYGVHLGAMGRFDEARRELDMAVSLDPLSPIVNLNLAYPALYQRHFEVAIDGFNKVVAMNASFAPTYKDRMTLRARQGDLQSAVQEAISFLRLSGQPELAETVTTANSSGGPRKALESWLALSEQTSGPNYVSPMVPASLSVALGDRERSISWLTRAFEQRCPQLVYLAADPQYDSIRSDARFQRLLQQIGLPVQ